MSLTTEDLSKLRVVIREEVDSIIEAKVIPRFDALEGRLEALESDVKELYMMVSELQRGMITDESFKKRSIEEKLLTLNAELLATAEQAGVKLPR